MNWLDITILVLAGIGLIKGLYDGMIKQVVALVAMILGLYLSVSTAGWMRGYLTKLDWFPEQLIYPASYFLGFVIIVGIILFAGHIIHRLISITPLSLINHIMGGVLGVILMMFFMSFMLIVIERFDSKSVLLSQEIKMESRFYYTIKTFIPTVLPGNIFEYKLENAE